MKQERTEATMRNCHGNAVGILVIYGEEDVKAAQQYSLIAEARNPPLNKAAAT
jgi:hypothetical protein